MEEFRKKRERTHGQGKRYDDCRGWVEVKEGIGGINGNRKSTIKNIFGPWLVWFSG